MKKLVKLTLHIFSLAALTVLVFTGGVFNKLSTLGKDGKETKDQPEGLFSTFVPHKAFADAPAGDAGCVGPGSEACSGEGDGGGGGGAGGGAGSGDGGSGEGSGGGEGSA